MVLADAPGEAHDEAADRRVLEEQPELVDDEHPPAVLAFDPRPQGLCEQEVDRRHHLVAQLAHAEDDDRRFEIDVGGSAEHPAQAAVDPAVEDDRDPRGPRHALGDVAKHGLGDLVVRLAGGAFDNRALRLVESAADARAEVDRVGGGGPEPGFIVAMLGAQVEDVEGGSGAQRELDVDAAEPSCQAAVLVLGIDDEDLGAGAERAHGEGRKQVCLPGARVAEDSDVGVGVATLVEGIDQDRGAGRAVAADEEPAGLLQVRLVPRKEGDQRRRIEDSLALEAVGAAGLGRE